MLRLFVVSGNLFSLYVYVIIFNCTLLKGNYFDSNLKVYVFYSNYFKVSKNLVKEKENPWI